MTELLLAWRDGDEAALDKLTPLVYRELRRLASLYMAGERQGHLLESTALVNEAYLRLTQWKQPIQWQNRAHFFGVAAQLMRRILVDFARAQRRHKRGAGAVRVSLSDAADAVAFKAPDLLALDDALQSLAELDPRHSRVVELRFFGGLSHEDVAEVLNVSAATVRRDWSLARAWLYTELQRRRTP